MTFAYNTQIHPQTLQPAWPQLGYPDLCPLGVYTHNHCLISMPGVDSNLAEELRPLIHV